MFPVVEVRFGVDCGDKLHNVAQAQPDIGDEISSHDPAEKRNGGVATTPKVTPVHFRHCPSPEAATKMDNFLSFPGGECFTESEAAKLKTRINKGNVQVEDISGIWIHYAHLRQSDVETISKIEQLLSSKGKETLPLQPNSQLYYITPRNISPWSSKATSIAHVGAIPITSSSCGVAKNQH